MMGDEIENWKKLNLGKDRFKKEPLDHMICEDLKLKLKDPKHKCTQKEIDDPKNLFLPQDQEMYTETEKVKHYTFVFNIFVFLQIFNIINSRKIEGELNVFSDFFNNCLFVFVLILTVGV